MNTVVKKNGTYFPEIPSLFESFLKKDLFNWPDGSLFKGATLPAVNVKENDKNFELEVAAPGMNKDNFKVEIDNNMLMISAEIENREEEKDKKGNYTRREFSYQSFNRSFNLPERLVEADKIDANYRDGILHIIIPKKEEAKYKSAKLIKVK